MKAERNSDDPWRRSSAGDESAMCLSHLSLCSGIGGIDLAAKWAGFETVAQCEIDEYASKVLMKNFPGVVNLHDIRTVTAQRLAEYGITADLTVISAGFPCQPYSVAGKGRGDRDERDLWGEVARVLGDLRPRWFVGENTPGLFSREHQRFFRRILDDLAALGYSVGWGIWGACDVGAPHKRQRVFILAHRDISDPACERRISRRETIGESHDQFGNQERKGALPGRACRRFSDAYGDGLWMFGRQEEACLFAAGRNPNGRRAKDYGLGQWWQTEPDVGRVAHGVSARVDRLRCLGNAVVPMQAYPIFEAIKDYELSGGQ